MPSRYPGYRGSSDGSMSLGGFLALVAVGILLIFCTVKSADWATDNARADCEARGGHLERIVGLNGGGSVCQGATR